MVELLVVIVIIGALSAIALPSFLNNISKARGSEAKANLGTINRAQQVYRFDNQVFSPDLSILAAQGMNISSRYYTYSITGNSSRATAQATPINNDLKVYASGIVVNSDSSVTQVICESIQSKGAASNNTASAALTVDLPASAGCSSGNVIQ